MRRTTTLALLALACASHLFAQSQPGIDAWNGELQRVWDRLRPHLERELTDEARLRLQGEIYRSGETRVTIRQFRGVRFAIQTAPGIAALAADRLDLAVPASGSWELELEADIRVRARVLFFTPTVDLPRVRVRIFDVRLTAHAAIDSSDPTRPVLSRVDTPVVAFRLELRAANPFVSLLTRALSPTAERLARRAVDRALADMAPQLATLQGLPGPVPGEGTPALTDSGAPTPFGAIVAHVERKARRDNLPHGTIVAAKMDLPAWETWEQAYGPGGVGNPGQVVRHTNYGDSAIFTGQWLAGQAYRYALSGDPAALEQVRHALAGVSAMLEVNGGRGLLARCAAPENSPLGQELVANGVYGRAVIAGETWVGFQGGIGITRDQYSGVFFGLAVTHDLVNDPAIQAECALRVRQMLDYLVANGWYVEEDRPQPDLQAQGRRHVATFWAGTGYQQLAWLHVGERTNPGRYTAELDRIGRLAECEWLSLWLSTFNQGSYYKFNLYHLGAYTTLRLETDPTRWQEAVRGFRIVQRYVGHHWNPHFDVIQTVADPGLAATLHPCVRESLRRFVQRPHRLVGPPVVDLSGVTWVTHVNPTVPLPGQSGGSSTVTLPSAPLDPAIRLPESDFLWQRSPFEPASPGSGDPAEENTGLCLVQPFWMARFHGVGF